MFSLEGLSELVVLQVTLPVHFRGPRNTLARSSPRFVTLLLLPTTIALKLRVVLMSLNRPNFKYHFSARKHRSGDLQLLRALKWGP